MNQLMFIISISESGDQADGQTNKQTRHVDVVSNCIPFEPMKCFQQGNKLQFSSTAGVGQFANDFAVHPTEIP
jgi:hypothetical protein